MTNIHIAFVCCILFTSYHLSWSFPMLSWWPFSQRRQSHPQIPRTGEELGQLCRCICHHHGDNNIIDRKRKAPQQLSLGPENKQEIIPNQIFPCCDHPLTFVDDAPTTTSVKRICSDGSRESSSPTVDTVNNMSFSTTAITPELPTETSNQPITLSEHGIHELLWKEAKYNNSAADVVVLKRLDYLVWDDFFMGMAKLSAMRSKDPKAPSTGGACIVDAENRIVGIGYNGFPRDCSDDCLPWWSCDDDKDNTTASSSAKRPWLQTQSPYVCHAEVNAILNKCSANVEGARLYVAQFPCNDCAKVIIQSRIKEVVYMDDTDHHSDSSRASRIMFTMAGVTMRHYQPLRTNILLDFASVMVPPNTVTTTRTTTTTATEKSSDNNDESTIRFQELFLKEAGFDPVNTPSGKRTAGVLSWDDWFMAVAFLSAKRSKDPNTQVGACIVDGNKRIVALGYNGFPRGCSDDYLPWARTSSSSSSPLHTKYWYVCHAEVNAILNKGSSDVKGATLYVALFPCNDCAKVIIQAGIRQVVYLSDQYHDTDSCRASRIMFAMAAVQLRQHIPSIANIMIDLQ